MPTVAPQYAEPPLILTIDIGTSSTRALFYDRYGRAVAGLVAQELSSVQSDAEGRSEENPDMAFARVARCIDAALAQAGPLASQIGGVALDTLVTSIMAVDAAGRSLTPLQTYADTRCAPDATELRRQLDERAVHQRTGCLLRTSYWPARLAWFRRVEPAIWHAATRWITLGEYLELQLFGQCHASYSAASWSGLLDRRSLNWDTPLLAFLGLAPERLSPLADVSLPLRGLRPEFAARWPTLRNIPFFPAIGDGAAANIGSGCVGPGRVALTVGTTGALRVVLPEVTMVPPGLWCYRVDGRRALLGGATSEGGNVYRWMRDTLRVGEPTEIEAALAAMAPDSHGLTILPFLAGERSPGWAGDVKATISGLAVSTTPLEILRAGLEAVAYRFALIIKHLLTPEISELEPEAPTATPSQATIIASGGGLLNSPTWMQMMADVLALPVVASAEPEATSRGAALLALEALGTIPSIEALPADLGALYTPRPEYQARYQAAIERQRQLYDQLIGVGNR